MIPFIDQNSSLDPPKGSFEVFQSVLIGVIGVSIFLPMFFAIWIGKSFDRNLIHSYDEFGPRKKNLDQFLVTLLFVVWLVVILLGYSFWNIQGALIANFFNGIFGGACLGFWMYLPRKSGK